MIKSEIFAIIGPILAERGDTIGMTTLAKSWPAGQTDIGPMLAANVIVLSGL